MTATDTSLDDILGELYAGSRATFVERRKELAAAARRGGDKELAKAVGELRKPSAAAHLLNLLARAEDSSLHELIRLGANIRAAIATGDDQEMLSLLQTRSTALAAVMRTSKAVARDAGESVSGPVSDQIMQTLRAAMASAEAADAVAGGCLVDALDEPGFEGLQIDSAPRTTARPKPGSRPAKAVQDDSAGRQASDAEVEADTEADDAAEAKAAALAAARSAAQARVKSVTARVRRSEKELAAVVRRRDVLVRDRERVAAQLAQLDDQLAVANAEVDDGETQLREASHELNAANSVAALD